MLEEIHACTELWRGVASFSAGVWQPQEIANVLWASATMRDFTMQYALVPQLPVLAVGMRGQEISSSLWALARLAERTGGQALANSTTNAEFTSQGFANVLWASASLLLDVDVWGRLDNFTDWRVEELAGLCWSIGAYAAGYRRSSTTDIIWETAAAQLGPRLVDSAQAFSNLCWAAAVLRRGDDSSYWRERFLNEFAAQEIANVMWACAVQNWGCDIWVKRAAQQYTIADLQTDQGIANVAWSLGELRATYDPFFRNAQGVSDLLYLS